MTNDDERTFTYADIVSRMTLGGYVVRSQTVADGTLVIEAYYPGGATIVSGEHDAEFYIHPDTMVCYWGMYWNADDDTCETSPGDALVALGLSN